MDIVKINGSFPTKTQFKNTQYSFKKTKNGKRSVPFLALDSGKHIVEIENKGKIKKYLIKTWLSPFGWAWIVIKEL